MKQRVRIRFCKQGDLRLIGHRDLVRTFERLFRRASLPLAMSEGYHPRVRMTFPSALAVGIEGTDEVMEVVLADEVDAARVRQQLNDHAPPGLTIQEVLLLDQQQPKARVTGVAYAMPIPAERRKHLTSAIDELRRRPREDVQRQGATVSVDLGSYLERLSLDEGLLRIKLQMPASGGIRPREVLQLLGVDELESQGCCLTRTRVEIAT